MGFHWSAVKWFSSYLSTRTQQTYISGVSSNPGHVVSGVPPGICFETNRVFGLHKCFATWSIKIHSWYILQITQPYLHTANVLRTSTLSEDLNKNDHMAINVTKSKIMCVTSKHNQSIIPQDFPGISYKDSDICSKFWEVTRCYHR